MRVDLQAGYVLHSRPWRDSSLIVEFFSRESGRVSLVARGAKSRKVRGGSAAALLQPFTALRCSWSGRGQLRTLTHCETTDRARSLRGRQLYSGLYMNELLVRLLHHEDPHQKLFDHYTAALTLLSDGECEEIPLRCFELVLLEELGYGFDLSCDGRTGDAVAEEAWYHFDEDYGLVLATAGSSERQLTYPGIDLLRISRGDFSGTARQSAKRLMRQALSQHLGDRPLKSRELFLRRQHR
jgi:DNA repair protein RecO (recombination protein O)